MGGSDAPQGIPLLAYVQARQTGHDWGRRRRGRGRQHGRRGPVGEERDDVPEAQQRTARGRLTVPPGTQRDAHLLRRPPLLPLGTPLLAPMPPPHRAAPATLPPSHNKKKCPVLIHRTTRGAEELCHWAHAVDKAPPHFYPSDYSKNETREVELTNARVATTV